MTNSRPSAIPQPATFPTSADSDFDFVVIGSGFAGSLIATILQTQGRRVAIVDHSSHPRFAIGESSTPAANLILSSLADQYDLAWLKPFARYGTWKTTYPEIATGRKRGFSYFHHEPGKSFQPRADHSNELLAAASSSDEVSDTQWLRSDVDAFFFKQACQAGVEAIENSEIASLGRSRSCWQVEIKKSPLSPRVASQTLSASFLIDASGGGQALAKLLNIPSDVGSLATNSRAIFGHVTGLPEWSKTLESSFPNSTNDHPFNADHAAQHHILDEGWMWALRFDNDVTSVGVVLDQRSNQHTASSTSQSTFHDIVNRYPSLRTTFTETNFVNASQSPMQTKRLQRLPSQIIGEDWALLPHTAGFIDPLHSTGIAHSLAGVERLAAILLARSPFSSNAPLDPMLQFYALTIQQELTLIDQLVAGCYDAIARQSFRKFIAFTMCYFAAATTWERQRLESGIGKTAADIQSPSAHFPALLCADNTEFTAAVLKLRNLMPAETDDSFESLCKETLAPSNHIGLFEPPIPNMYGGTALPEDRTLRTTH